MAKKTFSSKNLDMKAVLQVLQERSMVRLKPTVRNTDKTVWDALVGALLLKRCDFIVLIVDKKGRRYERVRNTSTNARITQQLAFAVIEYVLRPSAETPKWVQE